MSHIAQQGILGHKDCYSVSTNFRLEPLEPPARSVYVIDSASELKKTVDPQPL